jgi:EAL domain-containing protein (putative c-di-GMP-specific phosphodiesterase class I)/DNA-binding response OmpR family regulator
MNDKKYKILVLDPGFYKRSVLQEILVKNEFNVHVSTTEADASKEIDSFKPDIILCRASSRMIKDNKLLCGFHDVSVVNRIPFVIISSGAGVDFYLRGLEHGVSHSIMPPFNSEFLVSRIMDILERDDIRDGEDAPLSIQFKYHGADYSLSVTSSQLVDFIISMLHDSVNHSVALTEVMQKKNFLRHQICKAELFDGLQTRTDPELQLERDMYRALEKEEFVLHYQPIINMTEERIAGFEALIRWRHPELGLVPPDQFIPAAERLPLIIPLGFWVIEEAARQLCAWEKMFSIDGSLHMGINLSARQFVYPELGSGIKKIIRDSGVDPAKIAFEITESAFMNDMETANLQLLKLKSEKHLIYMDDFGTGYSSLSYLQHFPVDTLKIDQSFVRWMHIDEQSEHIVRSVVGLAHNLGMNVVAEGVEEEKHNSMLRDINCDYGQGFFYSTPLEPVAAEEYLGRHFRKRRA